PWRSNPSGTGYASVRPMPGYGRSRRSAGKRAGFSGDLLMSRRGAAIRWMAGGTMDEAGSWTGAADAATARVEAMVRDYQVKLARYVRRMTGDAEAALDLTQD